MEGKDSNAESRTDGKEVAGIAKQQDGDMGPGLMAAAGVALLVFITFCLTGFSFMTLSSILVGIAGLGSYLALDGIKKMKESVSCHDEKIQLLQEEIKKAKSEVIVEKEIKVEKALQETKLPTKGEKPSGTDILQSIEDQIITTEAAVNVFSQPKADSSKTETKDDTKDVLQKEEVVQVSQTLMQEKPLMSSPDAGFPATSMTSDVLPLGTILPWLPSPSKDVDKSESIPEGWMECNGGTIDQGPWKGQKVPDLNGQCGLFLRGGPAELAGKVEEDALQDHTHIDSGHTHIDLGHTHSDQGHIHEDKGHVHVDKGHTHEDSGHIHATEEFHTRTHDGRWYSKDAFMNCLTTDIPTIGTKEGYANIQVSHAALEESRADIQVSHADITSSQATLDISQANISGARKCRMADETRPANIRVVWIIKVVPSKSLKM